MAHNQADFMDILVDPPNADVDVVAIHGLNPFDKADHAIQTWSNGEHMWLRDAFPHREPTARVMLLGYNANVIFQSSMAGVDECADILLERVAIKRRDHPRRPLIFICHSLGGIVVKAALVEANASPRDKYRAIAKATSGLVFFATPHDGSDSAKWGEVAAKIACTLLRRTQNSFLDSLRRDSVFSETLKKSFRHRLDDYQVVSFFENVPMNHMTRPIVDRKSAVLNLSSRREATFGLNLDHVSICKFGPEDPNYEIVEEQISDLCREAVANGLETSEVNEMKDLQKMCISILARNFPELGQRHRSIIIADDKSTDWFFNTPEYLKWDHDENKKSFLSVEGSPGWGKSVLLKEAISRLDATGADRRQRLILSFFFDSSHEKHQPDWNSSVALFRTLLYQAVDRMTDWGIHETRALKFLREIASREGSEAPYWTFQECQKLLSEALKLHSKVVSRIYIFIDALDEWDTNDRWNAGGLKFFERLELEESSLKICSSRRPYPSFANGLKTQEIVFSREALNEPEVRRYLKRKVDEMDSPEMGSEKKQFLLAELSPKAESNFLWSYLAVSAAADWMADNTLKQDELERRIRETPPKLSRLYQKLLSTLRTNPQERAEVCLIFKLVAYARDLLSPEEVMDVVLLHVYPRTWETERIKLQTSLNYTERIKAITHGLINVVEVSPTDESVGKFAVSFTHGSIRTYMVEEGGLQALDPAINEETCDLEIFKICLKFLEHDVFIVGIPPPLSLRSYVTSFWMEHARGCDRLIPKQDYTGWPPYLMPGGECNEFTIPVVEAFLESLLRHTKRAAIQADPSLLGEDRIVVFLAASGCTSLLSMHRSCSICRKVDSKGDPLARAFHQAVEHDRVKTAQCLEDDFGCDLNLRHFNSTPLYHACYLGHEEMVKYLLSRGADVQKVSGKNYKTALNAAVGTRNERLVSLLVENAGNRYGQLLKWRDTKGQTALHIAARFGLISILMKLLPRHLIGDASIQEALSRPNGHRQTALQVAIEHGNLTAKAYLEFYTQS